MDGNFTIAPNIFDQLYVIRAPLGDAAVTCVYALLSGKSQAVYDEMFRGMEAKCEELGFNLDPSTVTADFEVESVYYFDIYTLVFIIITITRLLSMSLFT